MSGFGFLVRWGSMGLGAMLLIAGGQAALTYAPRDENAKPMTTPEVLALAGTGQERFVALEGTLDEQTRVYESFVSTPRFVRTDPNQVYTVRPGKDSARADLIGVTVAIQYPLVDGRIECQVVRQDSGGKSLQSMRVLAPVQGTDGMMWVLSSDLYTEAAADTWQQGGSFQGALSRFDDLATNASELGYQAQQIRDYARENIGIEIPPGATIVLEGQGMEDGVGPRAAYAAVEGTGGNLIARVGSADAAPGPLTGMLDASPLPGWQRDLPNLIGSTSPSRVMMLDTTTTAAAENAKDRMAVRIGLVGGVLFFGFGASTTWLKHTLKKRRRAAAALGALRPDQSRAIGIPMRGTPAGYSSNPFQQAMPVMAPPAAARQIRTSPPAGSAMAGSPRATDEDRALEAEMASWTNGSTSRKGLGDKGSTQDRRAA